MLLSAIVTLALAQAAAPAKVPLAVTVAKVLQGQRALAFAAAPTGSKFAATMEDKTIKIFDASDYQTLKVLEGHPVPAYAIAWSADGAFLATGDESARIFIWDTRTWKKVREVRTHIRGIQALSFNYSRTLLVSTGKDDVVKVWDVATGKELRSIPGQGLNFFSAKFRAKTNDFGVGFLGEGARFYSAPTGKVMGFLTGHEGQGILDIAFNTAGTRAVTGGKDGKGALWDVATGKRLNYLRGSGDWVVHCDFSPNGSYVATSSSDRTVRLYSVFNFTQAAELDNQSAVGSPLCFTADGKFLVTVDFDDYIQVNTLTPTLAAVAPSKAPAKRSKSKRKGG